MTTIPWDRDAQLHMPGDRARVAVGRASLADCVKAFAAMGLPREAIIRCAPMLAPFNAVEICSLLDDPTYPY